MGSNVNPAAGPSRDPGGRAPRYAAAGVDVDANTRLIPRLRALAAQAGRPEVLGSIGAFAGIFDLSGVSQPLLVASTDGVGTKLLVARALACYDTVGEDLVNHCVNDILTAGARPLFFLDYLAGAGLDEDSKVAVVEGVARACAATGTALLGGETADMPGLYRSGDFDIAGTIVGVVEKGRQIEGTAITPGDAVFALPSNGLHTNGYSLAREVLGLAADPERARALLAAHDPDLGESLGAALLRPHRCYLSVVEPFLDRCKGIAHITGGGVQENLERILPEGVCARLDPARWSIPPLFGLIQRRGAVSDAEMYRVFNMGVGMIVVVAREDAEVVRRHAPEACDVGSLEPAPGSRTVEIVGIATP